MCLGALFADSRINGGAKVSVKSFFMEIVLFFSVYSVLMKCQAKLILLGVSNRLWVAGLERKKRKVRIKPALRLKRLRYPHVKIKEHLFSCGVKFDSYVKVSAS